MIKKTFVALKKVWKCNKVAALFYCGNLVGKLLGFESGYYRIRGNNYWIRDRGIATLVIYKEIVCGMYDVTLKPGMRVLDVGAHVGMFVIPLAKENPNVSFMALEPDGMNYKNLLDNLKNNAVENVVPMRVAISDRVGFVDTVHNGWNSGASKTIPGYSAPCVPINAFGHFDLMKVDIEGAEYIAIKSKTDWAFAAEMIIEIHPHERKADMLVICKGARIIEADT